MIRCALVKTLALSLTICAVTALSAVADPIPTLNNTGIGAQGGTDANYIISGNPAAIASPVAGDYFSGAPVGTTANWISGSINGGAPPVPGLNNPTSVAPSNSAGPSVLYTYTNTFSLSGFQLPTVAISMQVASDNGLVVKLNGTQIGSVVGGTGITTSYANLSNIVIATGSALFNQTVNTLTYEVTNAPPGQTGNYNPQALLVLISGTGTPITPPPGPVIPEPASLALWVLLGAAGGAGRFLRRRQG